jgi:hypothetical protein
LVLDTTNKTDLDKYIYLEFDVYTVGSDNSYGLPNRPAEATYMQIMISKDAQFSKQSIVLNRNVYVRTRLEIPIQPLYYLRYFNKYDKNIYVISRIEYMNKLIKPISK